MKLEQAKKRIEFHKNHDVASNDTSRYDVNTYICTCIIYLCSDEEFQNKNQRVKSILNDPQIFKSVREERGVFFLTLANGYVISFSKLTTVSKELEKSPIAKRNEVFTDTFEYTLCSESNTEYVIGTYNYMNDEDVGFLTAWSEFDKFAASLQFNLCMKKKDFFHFFKTDRIVKVQQHQLKEDLANKFYGLRGIDIKTFYLAREDLIKSQKRKR